MNPFGDPRKLMKQLQQAQERIQAEIAALVVEATAGGGMVLIGTVPTWPPSREWGLRSVRWSGTHLGYRLDFGPAPSNLSVTTPHQDH